MENEKQWETWVQIAESDPETPSVDIHGMQAGVAEYEVEEFLDGMQGAGERVVRVIHGIGTGSLSSTIEKLLQRHWAVLYFRNSLNVGEGGAVKYVVLTNN